MKNITKDYGFTLLELLIVVSIAGILMAIATPAMTLYLKKSSVKSHQSAFAAAMSAARENAVNINSYVSICPTADGATCSGSWDDGWLLFDDHGNGSGGIRGDGLLNGLESALSSDVYNGTNNMYVKDTTGTPLTSLTFDRLGHSVLRSGGVIGETDVLLVFCDADDLSTHARGLVLSRSGRVMRSRDVDGDDIHDSRFESSNGLITTISLSCS